MRATTAGRTLLEACHSPGDDIEAWLTGSVDDARAALRQHNEGLMTPYPVSPAVNSPKNDNPRLLERVEPDAVLRGTTITLTPPEGKVE